MKKISIIFSVIAVILVASFLIPKETKPSAKTRIILEHHYSTYIAPKCFEQSDVTNYLEDSTLGEANRLEYEAHDECTASELAAEKDSLFMSILKDIGLIKKKWDNF